MFRLTTGAGALDATVDTRLRVAAILLAALADVGLSMLAFRVLIPTRHLPLGAVVAGIGWQLVQLLRTSHRPARCPATARR